MFALLRSRWLLLTVGLPLGAWALDRIAGIVEQRRGPSGVTRALRSPRVRLRQRARPA